MVSVIVPAYQEEARLGESIRRLSQYVQMHYPGTEVIVVCDGCTDRTAEVARTAFAAPSCSLDIIELPRNQGKGHAVRVGMLAATGTQLLFTDADLSFSPETIGLLLERLENGADVVIAQRTAATAYPGLARRALGALSRVLVRRFVPPGVRDSQAGCKGFSREAGKDLFRRLRVQRFLFDVELLVMARRRGYRIDTVTVDWSDRPGSRVRIVADSARALRDLTLIAIRDLTGRYR